MNIKPFNIKIIKNKSENIFAANVEEFLNDQKNQVIGSPTYLILMIDQKSEISVQDDNLDEKIISGEYLKNLFVRVEQFQMFDKVLNKLPHNELKKEKIKQERTKILIGYQNIKIKTKRDCNSLDLENLSEQELVEQIIQIIRKYDKTLLNDNLINAIAIECLCELWEEEL